MVVATLICSTSIVTAQTVEPSQTLTEIVKKKDCTVFAFNYPSVSAAGEETPHRKGKATLPVVVPMIIKGLCETHPAMKPYGLKVS